MIISLLTLLLCLLSSPVWAQVAITSFGNTDTGTGTSATIALSNGNGTGNYTCATGTTDFLYVTTHVQETGAAVTTVSDVVYNGSNLAATTLLAHEFTPSTGNPGKTIDLHRLPGSFCDGAAHDLTVTTSVARRAVISIIAVSGVDTGDPDDPPVIAETETVDADPAPCASVTTATDDLVYCVIAIQNSNTTATMTTGTIVWQDVSQSVTANQNVRALGASATGTGGVIINYNLSAAAEWTTVALNINAEAAAAPAAGSSGTGQFLRSLFAPFTLATLESR